MQQPLAVYPLSDSNRHLAGLKSAASAVGLKGHTVFFTPEFRHHMGGTFQTGTYVEDR